MSNKLINAVIALVENRPEAARSMLRSPEMKGISISEVQSRLYTALDKMRAEAARTALRGVLRESIKLGQTYETNVTEGFADREGYARGVIDVEEIVDEHIGKLGEPEPEVLARPHPEGCLSTSDIRVR